MFHKFISDPCDSRDEILRKPRGFLCLWWEAELPLGSTVVIEGLGWLPKGSTESQLSKEWNLQWNSSGAWEEETFNLRSTSSSSSSTFCSWICRWFWLQGQACPKFWVNLNRQRQDLSVIHLFIFSFIQRRTHSDRHCSRHKGIREYIRHDFSLKVAHHWLLEMNT